MESMKMFYNLKIDVGLLEQQIKDLLESNIKEDSKEGIHSLLGSILDQAVQRRN